MHAIHSHRQTIIELHVDMTLCKGLHAFEQFYFVGQHMHERQFIYLLDILCVSYSTYLVIFHGP